MISDAAHIDDERPGDRGDNHRQIDLGRTLRPDETCHEFVETAQMEDGDADQRSRRHEQDLGLGVRNIELA
jgi:hypothetical protein